ncbi:hypothetical protein QBC34DRAFT_496876 [Podospora aff. communis PSN243]|uniref:DUF7779 domain-containing protein n=1 Tax=Podospora aff. communis PSN243 TaxID=3040156 RepID=A0AAV9GI00_9PEZI|nr:hypothetical protein QBC34DRAFT_496876 [Podospora aff. communis PSN243]
MAVKSEGNELIVKTHKKVEEGNELAVQTYNKVEEGNRFAIKTYSKVEEGNELAVKTYNKVKEVAVVLTAANLKEHVPPPMKFPVYSINIQENPTFFRRETELKKLHQLLIEDHNKAKPAAYALRGNPRVSADPENQIGILRTFSSIRRRLRLFSDDTIENSQKRWLLIFNNVSGFESVARFWPTSCAQSSAIIATYQKVDTRSIPLSHQVAVNPLDKEARADLLYKLSCQQIDKSPDKLTPKNHSSAAVISHILGGSPFYLAIAQGFMTTSGTALPEYLARIESRSHLGSRVDEGGDYKKPADATHDWLIQQLDPGATKLLYMIAFMNPEHVGEDLIIGEQAHQEPSLEFLDDRDQYIEYVSQLGQCSLVHRDGLGTNQRYLTMHRSNREAMLLRLNKYPEERDQTLERVLHLLRVNFSPPSRLQIANQSVWPRLTRVLPHVLGALKAFKRASPSMSGSEFFAQLISDVGGMDLYNRGLISKAYDLNLAVEKMLDSLEYPLETPLRGDTLTIRGLCTDNMAIEKRREGLEIRQKCLDIRQRCFATIAPANITLDDRMRLYNSYTDLVCCLQQINDFKGGPKDDKRLLYKYAKYYNQMAYVLLWENNRRNAMNFAKQARKALQVLEGTLTDSEKACGKDNIRTLEISLNVSITNFLLSDLQEAETRLRNTINTAEKISGWPRANTVRGRYYLSQVLLRMVEEGGDATRRDEALKLEKEAKEDLDQLLKLDDSDIASEYPGNFPLLFDYLVHWENRLVTPRKPYEPTAIPEPIQAQGSSNAAILANFVEQNGLACVKNAVQAIDRPLRDSDESLVVPNNVELVVRTSVDISVRNGANARLSKSSELVLA